VKIVGHTSADGDANYNLKLSEGRAKAAVDFLLSRDVDKSRLKWEGKGSQELKDPSNPNSEVNRRTEFIVFE
jgi:outer membrane protein OmpA-like peptidoglycan-associated protein